MGMERRIVIVGQDDDLSDASRHSADGSRGASFPYVAAGSPGRAARRATSVRRARAARVSVGLAVPPVGNRLLPTIHMLAMSWLRPKPSATEFVESFPMI